MDIINLKYTQQLYKTKIRLEKELEMVNKEIEKNYENCPHLSAKLTKGSYTSYRCIFCGKKMSNPTDNVVDISSYKEEELKGLTQEEKTQKINCIRNLAIGIISKNAKITREELAIKLQEEIEKEKRKIKE